MIETSQLQHEASESETAGTSLINRRVTMLRYFSAVELGAILLINFWFVWWVAMHLESSELLIGFAISLMGLGCIYVACVSPLIHRDTWNERGLGSWRTGFVRFDNLKTAGLQFGILLSTSIIILLAIAWFRNPDFLTTTNWRAFWVKLAIYLVSALVQDVFFMCFIFVRLKTIITGHKKAELATQNSPADRFDTHRWLVAGLGAMFVAIYHFPNFNLMIIVGLFALFGGWIFYNQANLLPLIICHALIGTILHRVLELHMRVGPFYWNPDSYVIRTLFPPVKELIGDLF